MALGCHSQYLPGQSLLQTPGHQFIEARDEEILMLADIPPTGAGAQLYSPGHIEATDVSDARLEAAKHFGADVIVNNSRQDPLQVIRDLTGDLAGRFRMVRFPAT
jgi:hypothetical protein